MQKETLALATNKIPQINLFFVHIRNLQSQFPPDDFQKVFSG